MAVYVRRCPWCGNTFTAGRKDKKYCSDSCRNNAFRWKHDGGWKLDGTGATSVVPPEEIVQAIVSLRASAQVLSAAAKNLNAKFRPVCERISGRVFDVLEQEGL